MIKADELNKRAGLFSLFGGHIAQNGITKKLMTEKTGKNIAKSIAGKSGIMSNIKDGAMNVISPEMGIIRNELAHSVKGFKGASKGERAAALSMMKGDFDKVLKSRTFANSKRLQAMADKMGISEAKNMISKNPSASLKEHEAVYKSHPIGKMMKGMEAPLRKVNPGSVKPSTPAMDIAEGAGNLALGVVDPYIAGLNMFKRYTGLDHSGSSKIAKGMKNAKEFVGKKVVTGPAESNLKKGVEGVKNSKVKTIATDFIMNPMTGGIHDLSNKMGLVTNSQLKRMGLSSMDIKNGIEMLRR